MLKLIYNRFRFEATTAREVQTLTLIFLVMGFLQPTPAQERGVSSASILKQKIAQYPDSLALRHQLARDYIQSSELTRAEQQLRAIIALAPTNFAAYNNLGNVFLLQDKLDSAQVNYFKALSLAGTADDSLGVHFNLAAVVFAAGANALAEKIWSEQELFFPDEALIVVARDSLEVFWAADGKKKNGGNGRNGKNGGSTKQKGRGNTKDGGVRSEAKSDEKRWAVVNDVANRLARNYASIGEYAKAESYLRAVLAANVESFATYNNLGNACFLQGKLDSAEACYSKALLLAKTADDSLGIRLNFGAWLHADNNDLKAATTIAEALRTSDGIARVERLLGFKFDAIDPAKASLAQLQGVTAFSLKQLVMKASNLVVMASHTDPKMKSAKPRRATTQREGRVDGAPSQRKAAAPKNEIRNVFFWAQ